MKIGIILETKEPEKAWNAFRFANTCVSKAHEVQVFLMGEAVECEQIQHETYNVPEQMNKFLEADGVLYACGTCIKSRQLEDKTACPISTMNDAIKLVEWADKVVTF
ncbi:DsrE family protein [Fodinisporobacter ferrooxydans]|uniref:DsrE family protein n=1 Tax=Fodinisporobacter ferrooxydans TaxID=2901836 RepID=A0ABY4CLM0_9BACL|nr:DsrE family protein [Alicyclobacillaceae bacterium MYW30-H2]